MQRKAELECEILKAIIKSKKLEGIPLIWIQSKLAMLIDGTPPEDIFFAATGVESKSADQSFSRRNSSKN
jgi:hypothetical protein